MFKEGVRDILEKLDDDLVGLIPVKLRVRQIAALLVLDKVRCQNGPPSTTQRIVRWSSYLEALRSSVPAQSQDFSAVVGSLRKCTFVV